MGYGYIMTVGGFWWSVRVPVDEFRVHDILYNLKVVFEKAVASSVTLVDLLISLGSAGLAVFSMPTVLNKASQVPRRTESIPTAVILTFFVHLFAIYRLVLTSLLLPALTLVRLMLVA